MPHDRLHEQFSSAVAIALAIAFLAPPVAADGQPAAKIPPIGYLGAFSPSASTPLLEAFRQGLRDLGYVEGQNIFIDYRWAEEKYDRLPGLAAEPVGLKVDVIVTYAPPAIQAAKEATRTIPIVMAGIIDPVATGFVASLARPGGEHHRAVPNGPRARGEANAAP